MTLPVPDDPLFILDYDGTLADVAERPHLATPHHEVPDLLKALQQRHPLAILTGRQVDDVGKLLGVEGLRVIGVHGIESGVTGGEVESLVPDHIAEQLAEVRERLPEFDDLEIEDKATAIAIHYRNAPDPDAARERLASWAEGVPDDLEALWGKRVLEIRPKGYDKGVAAKRLAAEHPGKIPIVIGDDTTDEEAFRATHDGITIKVGPGPTAAEHRLPDVSSVVAYLRRFLD